MVNNDSAKLNQLFGALSDPTRRAMLQRLAQEEVSVAELSKPFELSKSAITKHLKVLENAGLLRRTIDGRVHHCRLNPEPLEEASEWISFYKQFWENKLNNLESYLTESLSSGKSLSKGERLSKGESDE